MRGNSGFLRWLPSFNCNFISNRTNHGRFHIKTTILLICFLLISVITTITNAGPVSIRNRRMIREVYSELEVIKSNNNTEPDSDTCLLDGQQVPEHRVNCEKKAGCRAIQKTGYCCPDYQCDCERDGKTYINGEKLVDPETPCKVCYCQGGEINCNSVTCYIRHDCDPKFIPGRCCPEYDNCPPLENVHTSINKVEIAPNDVHSTSNEQTDQISLSSSTVMKQQEVVPPTAVVNSSNPLGIKIKEITKPEEIRIIDEKPKQTYQITKPFGSSNGSNPPKWIGSGEPTLILNPSKEITSSSTPETINKLENTDVNSVHDEDSLKTVRHTNLSGQLPASEELNSESAHEDELAESINSDNKEKENSDQEDGGKVVFIDRNGETITIFGIDGLQRGDIPDEMIDYEDKKVSIKRSEQNTSASDPSGPEIIYENSNNQETNGSDNKTTSNVEPVAAGSEDYITMVMSTGQLSDSIVKLDSTTEGIIVNESSEKVFETHMYTSGPDSSDSTSEETYDTVYYSQTTLNESTDSSVAPSSNYGVFIDVRPNVHEDDPMTGESNPAYPPIHEDDFSNRRDAPSIIDVDDYTDRQILLSSSSSLREDNYDNSSLSISTEGPYENILTATEGLKDDFNNSSIQSLIDGTELDSNLTLSNSNFTLDDFIPAPEDDKVIDYYSGSGSGSGQSPIQISTDGVEGSSEGSLEPETARELRKLSPFQHGFYDFINYGIIKMRKS